MIGGVLRRATILSIAGCLLAPRLTLLQGVECFRPSVSPAAATGVHHRSFPSKYRCCGQQAPQQKRQRPSHRSSCSFTRASASSGNNEGEADATSFSPAQLLEPIGYVSQPIVWISLYVLATTGHGLPAGPGGSIGALEGLAYLVVVVLALLPAKTKDSVSAGTLSRITIGLGLVVLASVAVGKGCVPNAKPILDYSAYLPVCGPEP